MFSVPKKFIYQIRQGDYKSLFYQNQLKGQYLYDSPKIGRNAYYCECTL